MWFENITRENAKLNTCNLEISHVKFANLTQDDSEVGWERELDRHLRIK